jgi:hypothetical protein
MPVTKSQKTNNTFAKHYSQTPSPVSNDDNTFSKRETLLGNVLGKGAFGIVREIHAVRLDGHGNRSM